MTVTTRIQRSSQSETRQLKRPSRLGLDVYDVILTDLMSAKIPPGSRMAVDAMARSFGVSQTPIREALARLEAEGLVIKTHLVGYSAAPLLDRARFDEIYDVRLALEPLAAGRAATHATPEDILRIMRLATRMPAQVSKGQSYSRFAKADAEFHDAIMVAAGNRLMSEMLGRMRTHMHLFRLFFHARVTREAADEHAVIVAKLSAHDAKGTEAAMRVHLERSRARFKMFFDDL